MNETKSTSNSVDKQAEAEYLNAQTTFLQMAGVDQGIKAELTKLIGQKMLRSLQSELGLVPAPVDNVDLHLDDDNVDDDDVWYKVLKEPSSYILYRQ